LETAVVHVADIVAHAMQFGTSGERYVPPLDPGAWDRIGMQPSQMFSLMARIDGQFTDTVRALRIDVHGAGQP
jgi:hypothetical protein